MVGEPGTVQGHISPNLSLSFFFFFFFGGMTSVATKLTEDPTLPPPYPFTPVTTRATHAWPREPVSAKLGLWRG